MRALKQGVDPNGIMNPGTLLPSPSQVPIETSPTIDLQSLKERVISLKNWDNVGVEDNSTDADAVISPAALAVVQKTEKTESWYNRIWGSKKNGTEDKAREIQMKEGQVEDSE